MIYPEPDFELRICPPELLAERARALPRPLVFTNGCFDLLHRGHVSYLAQARWHAARQDWPAAHREADAAQAVWQGVGAPAAPYLAQARALRANWPAP